MKILVVNAGSSSLKYQLIDMDTEAVLAKGGCERIGLDGAKLVHKANGKETVILSPQPTHNESIALVLKVLTDPEVGVIKSMDEIDAVGHRVVHSGETFDKTVLATADTLKEVEKLSDLAPLHNPANLIGIKACQAAMPSTPMAMVFDTAFHATIPAHAYMYGIAYEDYEQYKIRKYGFHGTSHKFVSQEAAKYLGREGDATLKVVTCHLGNGSSISAVKGGKCIDTSMGFTPLAGVSMGTRSGDIDPAVVEYLCTKKKMSAEDCMTYLNKKGGMAGISGVSSDFRDLVKAKDEGNARASLALDMFSYQCKKFVGSYAAAMGGVDCIVFTAGVGENTDCVRKDVCSDLEFLGIKLDEQKNLERNNGKIREISTPDSKVKVLVIPTNEELVIARETLELL
ncbi:MAG: acetate kinase [Clostridia bacterium]|nr:acetate kinase [Clostridia bacterium]